LGLLKINYEIHVFNDGSKDDSLESMKKALEGDDRIVLHDKKNSGHGPTILEGYGIGLASDWIFQVDSDDEMSARDFHVLWERRDENDFLVGVRAGRKSPWSRRIISAVSRFVVHFFYGGGVTDVNSPYRLFRTSLFFSIVSRIPKDTFAPNLIISGYANNKKVRILEVPISYSSRKTGQVSIKKWKLFKSAVKSFYQTIKFRFFSWTLFENRNLVVILFLFTAAFYLGWYASPFFRGFGYDKEVFRYVGTVIRNGGSPYKDVFDHKPPLIYFFSALLGKNVWVYWVSMLFLKFTSVYLFYKLTGQKVISILAGLYFLLLVNYSGFLQGGGLTREITSLLVFIVLGLVLFCRRHYSLLLGIFCVSILLTQQNEVIAVSPVIAYYVFRRPSFERLTKFITGICLVLVPTLAYFAITGSTTDFIEQAFVFNREFYVVDGSNWDWVPQVLEHLRGKGILVPALFLVVASALSRLEKKNYLIVALVTIAMGIQAWALSLSAQYHGHYFLGFAPFLAVLLLILLSNLKKITATSRPSVYLLVFLFVIYISPHDDFFAKAQELIKISSAPHVYANSYPAWSNLLKDVAGRNGQLYVFQNTPFLALNVDYNIKAPTKWVYMHFWDQYPKKMSEKFGDFESIFSDIERYETTYIYDCSKQNKLTDKKLQEKWDNYVIAHYNVVVEETGCNLLRRKSSFVNR